MGTLVPLQQLIVLWNLFAAEFISYFGLPKAVRNLFRCTETLPKLSAAETGKVATSAQGVPHEGSMPEGAGMYATGLKMCPILAKAADETSHITGRMSVSEVVPYS